MGDLQESGVPNSLWLFAVALFRNWWALMSCAGFTVLGVYAAATDKANAWIAAGSYILATLFFIVAAYRTWREEHDNLTAEIAKNQKPDIRGEAFNFNGHGINGESQYRGHWSARTEFKCELFLCNHSPVNTTLRTIEFDGSSLVPPVCVELDQHDLGTSIAVNPWIGMELPHGIGKSITVRGMATVDGMRLVDIPAIELDRLIVIVIDAFQREHRIPVKEGERLRFGERYLSRKT